MCCHWEELDLYDSNFCCNRYNVLTANASAVIRLVLETFSCIPTVWAGQLFVDGIIHYLIMPIVVNT